MNLYHLTQDVVDDYDTYSDAVVAARSAEAAVHLHPNENVTWEDGRWVYQTKYANGRLSSKGSHGNDDWPLPNQVKARLIGIAAKGVRGVVCASFHAG
jgi:hypothetical protein